MGSFLSPVALKNTGGRGDKQAVVRTNGFVPETAMRHSRQLMGFLSCHVCDQHRGCIVRSVEDCRRGVEALCSCGELLIRGIVSGF